MKAILQYIIQAMSVQGSQCPVCGSTDIEKVDNTWRCNACGNVW